MTMFGLVLPYIPASRESAQVDRPEPAQDDGEIRVRKLVDKPGGNRDMEWGMIHNSRTPLDIYHADWKSGTGAPNEWIGYFIYINGGFRLNSTGRRVAVVRVPSSSNR